MPQVLITPQGIYKYFRRLVQGHTGGGAEADDFYISKNIMGAVARLSYFKVGVGGPASSEITKDFFDAYCKDKPSSADTKGDLHEPINIYSSGGAGPDGKGKLLTAANFYNYGDSDDSKVVGVLSVLSGVTGKYWDIPGVAFQVACYLAAGEANFRFDGSPVFSPDYVSINEIGVFDTDDVMVMYGCFPSRAKNPSLSFKANCVAMLKALDYQLIVLPETTTTTTSSSSTTSTTTTLP